MQLPAPTASSPTEELADWVEFQAMLLRDGFVSFESLVKAIRISGSADAVGGARGDTGSRISQQVAEDAFIEIDSRMRACGGGMRYPFDVSGTRIIRQRYGKTSIYALLLMMSYSFPTTGHDGTATLFERLCTEAAKGYFGGLNNYAYAIRFGAPRRPPLAKFNNAIDHMCRELGEGGVCKLPELGENTGDDGLDIVAWRHFPDRREGKLIAFGQCAAGYGWEKKLTQLDGSAFCKKWLRNMLVVDPIRMFFLPRRVPKESWANSGIDGGILFDRCRIVACTQELDSELRIDCGRAAKSLLQMIKS